MIPVAEGALLLAALAVGALLVQVSPSACSQIMSFTASGSLESDATTSLASFPSRAFDISATLSMNQRQQLSDSPHLEFSSTSRQHPMSQLTGPTESQ
jgi:hypothetical protein